MEILSIALALFIISNPIGNAPTILALIKHFPLEQQKKILLREALFSLLIAIFFQFLGEYFLNLLHVKNYTVTICGGIILFIVAVRMIFSFNKTQSTAKVAEEPPFIVPIATPLISGPGLLTMIMLYSHQTSQLKVLSAILVAWLGVIAVLISAPYMQRVLGKRGLLALEQLMGMILSMIAMDMIVRGVSLFAKVVQHSS
jgi:multiple antibiotic resistance protein